MDIELLFTPTQTSEKLFHRVPFSVQLFFVFMEVTSVIVKRLAEMVAAVFGCPQSVFHAVQSKFLYMRLVQKCC